LVPITRLSELHGAALEAGRAEFRVIQVQENVTSSRVPVGRSPIVGTSNVPAFPLDLTRVTTLTFDCYGTLIDWEAGVIEVLRPLLARYGVTKSDDEIVAAFQDIEALTV